MNSSQSNMNSSQSNMNSIAFDSSVSKINISDERDLGAFIPSQLDDYGLNAHEFRIYCRLARRAGSGSCWESVNNMAVACKMNRKTAMRSLLTLINHCMVRQEKRPGKSDLYKLTGSSFWKKQPVPQMDIASPSEGHFVDKPAPQVDTTSPSGGHHQSLRWTPPVPQVDTKVFPQGSPISSSQELIGEKEGKKAIATRVALLENKEITKPIIKPKIASFGDASPQPLDEVELAEELIKDPAEVPHPFIEEEYKDVQPESDLRHVKIPKIELDQVEVFEWLDRASSGECPPLSVIQNLLDGKYYSNAIALVSQFGKLWNLRVVNYQILNC